MLITDPNPAVPDRDTFVGSWDADWTEGPLHCVPPPVAPVDIGAVALQSSVQVTWRPALPIGWAWQTNVTLYMSGSDGSNATKGLTNETSLHVWTGLDPAAEYEFWVQLANEAGNGALSVHSYPIQPLGKAPEGPRLISAREVEVAYELELTFDVPTDMGGNDLYDASEAICQEVHTAHIRARTHACTQARTTANTKARARPFPPSLPSLDRCSSTCRRDPR